MRKLIIGLVLAAGIARAEPYTATPANAALAWAAQRGCDVSQLRPDLLVMRGAEVEVWGFACARPPVGYCAAATNQTAGAAYLNGKQTADPVSALRARLEETEAELSSIKARVSKAEADISAGRVRP